MKIIPKVRDKLNYDAEIDVKHSKLKRVVTLEISPQNSLILRRKRSTDDPPKKRPRRTKSSHDASLLMDDDETLR